MTLRPTFAAFALGLFLAGCGPAKLDISRKYSMDAATAQYIECPAISKAQTITVEFSSDAPVDVYVVKGFKEDDDINVVPPKDKILGTKNGKEGTFKVEVPEKTATRVIIANGFKKSDVTVKVHNKQ